MNWINGKISQHKGFVFHRNQTFQLGDQRKKESQIGKQISKDVTRAAHIGMGNFFLVTFSSWLFQDGVQTSSGCDQPIYGCGYCCGLRAPFCLQETGEGWVACYLAQKLSASTVVPRIPVILFCPLLDSLPTQPSIPNRHRSQKYLILFSV